MQHLLPSTVSSVVRLIAGNPGAMLYDVDDTGVPRPSHLPLGNANDTRKQLETMQRAVGGNVEHHHLGQSHHRPGILYDAWTADDALARELPTMFAIRVMREGGIRTTEVRGPVLVTGSTVGGDTLDLTPEELHDIALFTLKGGGPKVITIVPEYRDA